jgi:hypothetical protein
MARYWNYWDETNSTATTTTSQYYSAWTCTSGTTSTCISTYATSAATYSTWVERYVITGFENWSDMARAVLTRLVNDETRTGFKITLWARDIEITDPRIMIRDLDWFLMGLRQVATAGDYQKIADHVAQVRAEIASGTLSEGGDVKQAPGDSQSGPTSQSEGTPK